MSVILFVETNLEDLDSRAEYGQTKRSPRKLAASPSSGSTVDSRIQATIVVAASSTVASMLGRSEYSDGDEGADKGKIEGNKQPGYEIACSGTSLAQK